MKRIALIMAIALGTALGTVPASAAPVSNAAATLGKTTSGIELARYQRHGRWQHNRHVRHRAWRHHKNWRHHNRYRGWHRYHSRPWNWRTRGCVIIGPIWYCP